MPDRRQHRGQHPDDQRLFDEAYREILRIAVAEYSWLLTRHYATDSALKLVGDHHGLTVRQRQISLLRRITPAQNRDHGALEARRWLCARR